MKGTNNPISLCYILSYRAPDYVRTRVLLRVLHSTDGYSVYEAINSSPGFIRYFQTLIKLVLIRILKNPDQYLLGFRGYELFPIVRILTLGKRLIFDHMMSPYDSLLNERKKINRGSILERFVYLYEKKILQYADIILTDTVGHKRFIEDLFKVDTNKVFAVPVGTDENMFTNALTEQTSIEIPAKKPFQVFFYGTFLPLHGIEIILKAAHILKDKPISFTIVGGKGMDLSIYHAMMRDLKLDNVKHREWIDYSQIPQYISNADICLGGPFGNTGQAKRVITGKSFQFLAMGRPTVIGNISDDYGFKDKINCILVEQGDEKALAEGILWGFENNEALKKIGENGYSLFQERFSTKEIKQILIQALSRE